MYELISLSPHDRYFDCPAKIGLVQISEKEVVLIDSGNDKDAGKKVLRALEANGWTLKAIYTTHSHADHTGGCHYLQEKTGCAVYARGMEQAFTSVPVLEPVGLYGGRPFRDLKNKFLMAQESAVLPLTEEVLPAGWKLLSLPGHSVDMTGFLTPDGTAYLGDCLSSAETLAKYGIVYLWDAEESLKTLEMLETLEAEHYVPAHAPETGDIHSLIARNRDAILGVQEAILTVCREKQTFESLLAALFTRYGLQMNPTQYVLIGSTIRNYLSGLYESGKILFSFEDNAMLWKTL